MTICRYFLQGNCRFGDRCRFEHTDPYESNSYSYSERFDNSYQGRGRSQAPQANYDQNRNRYNYDNRYANDRYSHNQPYYSSDRNYQVSRYDYNDSYNQASDSDYYANKYNRNKHSWVSEDYKRQIEQKTPRPHQSNNERFFDTSTPKSKTAFSFTDSNAQNSRHQPSDLHINERNLIDAEIIKEDVLLWELGNQWPFTCYCPTTGKSSFPGFTDLSPEELRHEAYKAKEKNVYNEYIASVDNALQEIKMKREQLKEPSIELLMIIEKIRNGEKFNSESAVDGISAPSFTNLNPTALEDMVADEVHAAPASFFGSQAASADSFSFKTTLSSDEAVKSTVQSFSFKTSAETVLKPNVQEAGGGLYTAMDAISEQDKEQFAATTFTLGKIPTVPPPQEMCF